jgi:hypothetical protein
MTGSSTACIFGVGVNHWDVDHIASVSPSLVGPRDTMINEEQADQYACRRCRNERNNILTSSLNGPAVRQQRRVQQAYEQDGCLSHSVTHFWLGSDPEHSQLETSDKSSYRDPRHENRPSRLTFVRRDHLGILVLRRPRIRPCD